MSWNPVRSTCIEGAPGENVDAARRCRRLAVPPRRRLRLDDGGHGRAGLRVGLEQGLEVEQRHDGSIHDEERVRVGGEGRVTRAAGGPARRGILDVIEWGARRPRHRRQARVDGRRMPVCADVYSPDVRRVQPSQHVRDDRQLCDRHERAGKQARKRAIGRMVAARQDEGDDCRFGSHAPRVGARRVTAPPIQECWHGVRWAVPTGEGA